VKIGKMETVFDEHLSSGRLHSQACQWDVIRQMRGYHLTVLHTPRCLGPLSLRWGGGAGAQEPGDLAPAYRGGAGWCTFQLVISPPAL